MSEQNENIGEQEIVLDVLKNSLKDREVVGMAKRYRVLAVGNSGNGSQEYSANTSKGEIRFFAKVFKVGREEDLLDRMNREIKSTELVEKIAPNSSYKIIGQSQETPCILTETIEGYTPLSVFVVASSNEVKTYALKGALYLLTLLHKNGLVHGDAQMKNFGVVPQEQVTSFFEKDPRDGTKVLDFEDAVFKDEVSEAEFRRLMKADMIKFFLSIFGRSGLQDTRSMEQREKLRLYFLGIKRELISTAKDLYGDSLKDKAQFFDEVEKEISRIATRPTQN